jgi:membrane protease YdiL (CAAX protease family)
MHLTPVSGAAAKAFAFGRFLAFAGLFYGLLLLFSYATRSVHLHGTGMQALLGNLTVAAAALAATGVLAALERKSPLSFGLYLDGWWKLFGRGLATGFALLLLLLIALSAISDFRFGAAAAPDAELFRFGVLYGCLFCAVAVAEESLWRGYALVSLSQCISFWPAAIVLSLIFGASHLKHDTEDMRGVFFAAAFGVIFAWSFRRTGSLWFALGVHASWDYSQSFIFGVPDSGVVLPGSLLHASMGGPAWLTGGRVGPEGSVLMVGILALLAWIVSRLRTSGRVT